MGQFLHMFQVIPIHHTENPLKDFFQISGRYSNFKKETFFLRYVAEQQFFLWAEKCNHWQNQQFGYIYVEEFPNRLTPTQAQKYQQLSTQGDLNPSFHFQNTLWNQAFIQAWQDILLLFQQTRNCKADSILHNFKVKLLFWIDCYFPKLFIETTKMTQFPKFVCSGRIGISEYLFLYLLYRMGCDILYLGNQQDVSITAPELLSLSQRITQSIPPFSNQSTKPTETTICPVPSQRPKISKATLRRADREAPSLHCQSSLPSPSISLSRHQQRNPLQPMSFEQLAKFACSVVMLKVFDEKDRCVQAGSGIIINHKGYILTNFHVVSGGAYYGILLEEESNIFYTSELIKCHPEWDLAILRFDQCKAPIPILSASESLVRGQKVVAIGSPLGLLNTVSDGIISGFRELSEISMVQFTAPVSHGSSGGALIDTYGRLVGVITGGFNDGQNLNLAVDHKTILQFAGNLIV